VGLERGLLSLMSTIEELLGRKSSGSGLERQKDENTAVGIRHADHAELSTRKSLHYLRRQAAVARPV
jgi:hypothetical protein